MPSQNPPIITDLNAQICKAFVQADESFSQIDRARWLRGLHLQHLAATRREGFAEIAVFDGGTDLTHSTGDTARRVGTETVTLLSMADSLTASQMWSDLHENMLPVWSDWLTAYEAAREAEQAAEQALADAREAVRCAETALQAAVEQGDDEDLLDARALFATTRAALLALESPPE